MILKNINEQICNTCNSDVVKESKTNRHANGLWNELRVFSCGKELQYNPNTRSLVENKSCPHTSENKAKIELRKEAIARIENYIGKLNLDTKFKHFLIKKINESTG